MLKQPAAAVALPLAAATAGLSLQVAARRAKPWLTETPAHWIERIRTQLRELHREAALNELEKFRQNYPDYRLPDDLRDLK